LSKIEFSETIKEIEQTRAIGIQEKNIETWKKTLKKQRKPIKQKVMKSVNKSSYDKLRL